MPGNAIRGARVGSGPAGEDVRGDAAPRRQVGFFCTNGHEMVLSFALNAEVPNAWDCVRCGMPASQDHENPPTAPHEEPYKTHLAYAKDRRSDDEAAQILTDALQTLRMRRRNGDIVF